MDKKYIEQYSHLEKTHWWFFVRQKIILQAIGKFISAQQKGKLRVLNVGAATGETSRWLSVLGSVESLENDRLFLSILADQDIVIIDASVTDIPLESNSFDLVCAFDVIEHVEQDELAMNELVRVCKPHGIICITVPAFQSLWGSHDIINGHKRRYKKKGLINLALSQPATYLYSTYFNSILFVPIFVFRKLQWIFKRNTHRYNSDFSVFQSGAFINKALMFLFGIELFLLKSIRFTFGVSLLMLFRKNSPENLQKK